jgi:predicted GIY-YIG superfamily endonuclease
LAFDRNKSGWFYIIENQKLGYYKVGICNVLETRIKQHGNGWTVLFAYRSKGSDVAMLEAICISWIMSRGAKTKAASTLMRYGGHTETFKMTRRVSYKNLHRFLNRKILEIT